MLRNGYRWVIFSFSNYEREVDKWEKLLKYFSFKMTYTVSFYYVFLYLDCFLISTYRIFVGVSWILKAYGSSPACLFIRLQNWVAVSQYDDYGYMQ